MASSTLVAAEANKLAGASLELQTAAHMEMYASDVAICHNTGNKLWSRSMEGTPRRQHISHANCDPSQNAETVCRSQSHLKPRPKRIGVFHAAVSQTVGQTYSKHSMWSTNATRRACRTEERCKSKHIHARSYIPMKKWSEKGVQDTIRGTVK